jgi:DNA-directed RNA polymerase specialized sigma24 family protein
VSGKPNGVRRQRVEDNVAAWQVHPEADALVQDVHALEARQRQLKIEEMVVASKRSLTVLRLYELTGLSYTSVGALLGLSHTRVSQMVTEARGERDPHE